MNQGGFAKVFNSILDSTIWSEDSDTRVVWVTMLVMSDQDGYVWAAVPGLARRAQVSLEACQKALAKLEAPDQFSRTPDHDGRRIEPVDGGWFILNRTKYRNMNWEDEQRDRKNARNRKYYERLKASQLGRERPKTSEGVRIGHKTETYTETYTETKKEGGEMAAPVSITPDLPASALARGLCESLNMPVTNGNLRAIAPALEAVAREKNIELRVAYSILEGRAKTALSAGESVTKFWFEDSRWREAHGTSSKDRQKQEMLARIARELVAKNDRET